MQDKEAHLSFLELKLTIKVKLLLRRSLVYLLHSLPAARETTSYTEHYIKNKVERLNLKIEKVLGITNDFLLARPK